MFTIRLLLVDNYLCSGALLILHKLHCPRMKPEGNAPILKNLVVMKYLINLIIFIVFKEFLDFSIGNSWCYSVTPLFTH